MISAPRTATSAPPISTRRPATGHRKGAGLRPLRAHATGDTRSRTTIERDRSARARSEVARIRDETADRRDREAEIRDLLADARGETTGARDRALARLDRIRAADDRREAAEELASEGTDHLTGALRRRVGLAAIEREIDRATRTGDQLVVAFIDVDGLKDINDARGHRAGDTLLRGVVATIHLGLRPYDLVVRYGGDEFVCSLAGQGVAGIRARFDRINAEIGAAYDGASISVGLAEAAPDTTLDALMEQADEAMMATRTRRRK